MKRQIYALLLIFPSFLISQAQTRTVGLVKYTNKNQDGYLLFSPNGTTKTFLMDKCGRKVNEWTSAYAPGMSVALQPDGTLYRAGASPKVTFGGGTGGIIEKFDWDGNIKWTYVLADSNNVMHHDFKVMPNGHLLVIIWENHTKNDAISQGRNPTYTTKDIWSERISEIEPYGTDSAIIHWEWRAWDHLIQDYDSTKPNYGVVKNHRELFDINFSNNNTMNSGQDWFHFNAVDYNAQHDQIVLTSHALDEIYIIDHSTSTSEAASHSGGRQQKGGDVLYRWGNPISYRQGSSGDRKLFKPHHAHWAVNDGDNSQKIIIYNNGLDRPGSSYTSIISVLPPISPDGGYNFNSTQPFSPSSETTEYQAKNPKDFYSQLMGGSYHIGSDRLLITEATKGTIFEVYKDTVVWKYVNPYTGAGATKQGKTSVNNFVFRCQYYSPDFPGLVGKDLTPGEEIEADPIPNKLCEPPPPPKYAIVKINPLNLITGVADSIGVRCQISGIVQSDNFNSSGVQFILADKSGNIRVKNAKAFNYTPAIGDSVLLVGKVSQENGWLTFGNLDTLLFINSMNNPLNAIPTQAITENLESKSITMRKVQILNAADWPTSTLPSNSYKSITITHVDNTKDSIRIYSGTNISGTAVKSGYMDITGFVGQNDGTKPYLTNYFFVPSNINAFQASVLPKVSFQNTVDTLNQNQTNIPLNLSAMEDDEYSFDVVVSSSDAVSDTDYVFANRHIVVMKGSPAPTLTVAYGGNPKFIGNRFVKIAIRNIQGPATIGVDSVFTVYVQGKEEPIGSIGEINQPVHIYPNPAKNTITVATVNRMQTLTILDIRGSIASKTHVNGNHTRAEFSLANGCYFLKIQYADGSQSMQKLIIEN